MPMERSVSDNTGSWKDEVDEFANCYGREQFTRMKGEGCR